MLVAQDCPWIRSMYDVIDLSLVACEIQTPCRHNGNGLTITSPSPVPFRPLFGSNWTNQGAGTRNMVSISVGENSRIILLGFVAPEPKIPTTMELLFSPCRLSPQRVYPLFFQGIPFVSPRLSLVLSECFSLFVSRFFGACSRRVCAPPPLWQ